MKLCSSRSVRTRQAVSLLPVLGIALVALFIGCGTTPPEASWVPGASDTVAIDSVAAANRNLFTTGLVELALGAINTDLPGTADVLLHDELISNPFKQRFRADSMEHIFDPYTLKHTFIAETNMDSLMRVSATGETTWVPPNSETTCTIAFAETIPGVLRFHAYQMTRFLRDTSITAVNNYRIGYMASEQGEVFKTTDAGATWIELASGASVRLNAVSFPLDYFVGCVVGDGGVVRRTTDAGVDWSPGNSGTTENLNAVSFPGTRHLGYAVGDNGTVIKTTDAATTWTALVSGTTENLRSVWFSTVKAGVAVGANGTVLKSSNGTAWAVQTSGTTANLNAVVILTDNNTVYAAGDNGTIIKSTNGGAAWTTLTSGTSANLLAVAFPIAGLGIAVGDNGTILKTTNSGAAWAVKGAGVTTSTLRSVQFPENSSAGWAVGDNGTVVATTDGGETWSVNAAGTDPFYSVSFGAARDSLVSLPLHDTMFTDTSCYVDKAIAATTINGCVLRKQNGAWGFWKISGGGRFYAPTPEDAPYIAQAYVNGPGGTDTIFLRPDTLHFGMQRFYELDSVPTYHAGDSIRFSPAPLTNVGDAADYIYLVRDSLAGDSIVRLYNRRYEFANTWIKFDSLIPPGLYRLYLEHIPVAVFWDLAGRYTGTIWGIPIIVK